MKENMQKLLDTKKAKNAARMESISDVIGSAPLDDKNIEKTAHAAENVFPTQIGRKEKSRGPGWTPFKAAERCDIPWPRFHKAMENGEVKFVDFGNQCRVTDQEIARIRGLHGLSPTPERPDEPPIEAEPLKPPRLPKDKLEAAE